jgi:type I restriction enzyme M protein
MFEQACKNIDNVFWEDAGRTSELDGLYQFFWVPFLKYYEALNCGIFA